MTTSPTSGLDSSDTLYFHIDYREAHSSTPTAS